MSKELILKILLDYYRQSRQSISFMLIRSKITETTPKTEKNRFLYKNVALLKKKNCTYFSFQGCCTYIKVEKAENSIVAHI